MEKLQYMSLHMGQGRNDKNCQEIKQLPSHPPPTYYTFPPSTPVRYNISKESETIDRMKARIQLTTFESGGKHVERIYQPIRWVVKSLCSSFP
jgi:hypothetical protein